MHLASFLFTSQIYCNITFFLNCRLAERNLHCMHSVKIDIFVYINVVIMQALCEQFQMWTFLQGSVAVSEPEWEPPSVDCPLRCPGSRKISKLTVKVCWLWCLYAVYVTATWVEESEQVWHCILFSGVSFYCRKTLNGFLQLRSVLWMVYHLNVILFMLGLK